MEPSGTKPNVFQWAPSLVWQLLRRTRSYPLAFQQFDQAIVETGDEASKDFLGRVNFTFSANIEFRQDPKSGSFRQIPATYDRGEESSRSLFEDGRTVSVIGEIPSPLARPHLQKFLAQFGDILRFPLPPNLTDPHVHLLEGLFTSRPAKLVSIDYEQWPNTHPAIKHFVVEVNEDYSDDTIAEVAAQELRAFLKANRSNMTPRYVTSSGITQKVSWAKLETALRIWDLKKSGKSDREIASEVYSSESPTASDQLEGKSWEEQLRSRVKASIKLTDKKIQMFER